MSFSGNMPRLVFTAIMLILSVPSSGSEELIWPIDSPQSITSTFGEPRPERFHYGVDVRSGGVTGRKVFALGNGFISRVRTTPFGYGKSLYITLDSGQTVVYAHLSGFLPEIENLLFKTRIKKRTYDVELWMKPYDYPVKKGQVVANSGDTGDGGPHLHFEIRDRDNHPLNPFDHGFKVKDTIPPVINAVVLIPLDSTSSVDGFPAARWFEYDSLKYAMPVLYGNIGVAVSAWDRANNSHNHLGVYSISLSVDSTKVFLKKYKKISYDLNHYGALDYLSGYLYHGNGYLSALFRRTGNRVDFYEGDGVLSITSPNMMHTLTVTAGDHAENTTVCNFPVIFGKRPVFIKCGFTGSEKIHIIGEHSSGRIDRVELWRSDSDEIWVCDSIFRVSDSHCDIEIKENIPQVCPSTFKAVLIAEDSTRSVPCIFRIDRSHEPDSTQSGLSVHPELLHDRILVHIVSSSPLASLPVVNIEKNGIIVDSSISTVPESETSWIASIPLPSSKHNIMQVKVSAYNHCLNTIWGIVPLDFTTVDLNSRTTIFSPDSLFSVTVEPGALYRPAPVIVDTVEVSPANGLKPVTKGYSVQWGDLPLKGVSRVCLKIEDEPPEGSALFTNSNENGWNFLSDKREGDFITGMIDSSVKIAVFSDTTAPYIKPLAPRPGGTIRARRPVLKAYVEDKGAGIEGSDSISMTIDNISIYSEYDFETHIVKYKLHNQLRPGSHTVGLKVTDRVGNSKTRSWKFRIK